MNIGRGDVVWADMAPTVGREQSGHRPYLVLSDARFHQRRQVVIAVPMTTTHKPWPTRVLMGPGSWAIAEQPTTVSVHRISKVEATGHDVTEVRELIGYLMGGPPPRTSARPRDFGA